MDPAFTTKSLNLRLQLVTKARFPTEQRPAEAHAVGVWKRPRDAGEGADEYELPLPALQTSGGEHDGRRRRNPSRLELALERGALFRLHDRLGGPVINGGHLRETTGHQRPANGMRRGEDGIRRREPRQDIQGMISKEHRLRHAHEIERDRQARTRSPAGIEKTLGRIREDYIRADAGNFSPNRRKRRL
jgi:hypothetical protein